MSEVNLKQKTGSAIIELEPTFEELNNPDALISHVKQLVKKIEATPHAEILTQMISKFEPLDFVLLAFPEVKELRDELTKLKTGSSKAVEIQKQIDSYKLTLDHYIVLTVENVVKVAASNRWGLCKNMEFIYLFNGAFWFYTDTETFQKFLGEASEKMGVPKFKAKVWHFREKLLKQFLSSEYLPTPEPKQESVCINLLNGTYEVTPTEAKLRPFDRADFITSQLRFEYNPEATAPLFEKYLNRVLPDKGKERQKILAEFLGYGFIKNGCGLKLEKALILYGSGANGKSVFNEIVNALLGRENVSSYSLSSLTDKNGYYRAMIANKLVNYASEINGNLETSLFKQLVSGEPIEARLPYGQPMLIRQYGKMIFNCNELPREVEHSNAYFRRFLIVPFDQTIPEAEQDKTLHKKIIENELPGVFNWVLDGLSRLLHQRKFTDCKATDKAVEDYRTQSDSVKLFLDENNYKPDAEDNKLIKDLYTSYRIFCIEDGFKPVNKSNFIKRLKSIGINVHRINVGNVADITIDLTIE